jgi:hypothetical protein
MSYPTIDNPEFLADLTRRKEIYSLKADPDYNFRDPPEDDPMVGKYLKIHSQQLFVRNFLNPNTPYKRLHLMHAPGCHAAGTPILMYTGHIKAVEDVCVGDLLMGDDDRPRRVLSLARGFENMYRITAPNTESFICNENHILTVKDQDGEVIDIPLAKAIRNRGYKIFHIGVEFPKVLVKIKPYKLGKWYGCGAEYSLGDTGHELNRESIPYQYKCNSRTNRLKLIAGIMDNSIFEKKTTSHCIFHCRESIRGDIVYVLRSVGLAVSSVDKPWVISVRGDMRYIPLKHAIPCGHYEKEGPSPLESGFTVEFAGPAPYFGFNIDLNGRYLLGDFTVTHNTGKTLAAISIAMEFIKMYKKIYANKSAKMQAGKKNYVELDRTTPSVFVMGFGGTKSAFLRDLLGHPELGFITVGEKEELAKLYRIAVSGIASDLKQLKEFYIRLKKRVTNKLKDGFFKFYGYDEFVNRLFISDTVKLVDLESKMIQRQKEGEDINLEDIIRDHIRSGTIQLNNQLLSMFEDSLLIADEIHNTYNMLSKNNRGVAIQFVLDLIPSVRFLSMSATPINNSPTEVVELINYLVPVDKKVSKGEIFAGPRAIQPGKLEYMGNITFGRISFLQDSNIKYFPQSIYLGETITLDEEIEGFKAGDIIPYLKFVSCPMSELHQNTYIEYVNIPKTAEDLEKKENQLPTDGYTIYDLVFPNPSSDSVGLFKSSEIKQKLPAASAEWKQNVGITVKKTNQLASAISGEFLRASSIGKYSEKYRKLLDILYEIITRSNGNSTRCQKIMIYHNRVRMSGVLFIQEILRANGYLDETADPVDSTMCCICGKTLINHGGARGHDYRPVRFIIAHSDLVKATMDQSLAKFNNADNSYGLNYMILIGSKKIKESYEFKDVQNLIILSLPINIPTLIQVLGRCVRKNSHINLPAKKRRVFISILVSTINSSFPHTSSISPEVHRYAAKLSDYLVIQKIERELNRNAVDATIHRDIIMSEDLKKGYFPHGPGQEPVAKLGNLYFEPGRDAPHYNVGELNMSTFNAYKYYDEEINTLIYIIKRLFLSNPVWIYDDLWEAVRRPPVGVELNPRLFSENNFIIALNNLVEFANSIISTSKNNTGENAFIDRLFDPANRFIYKNGERHKIVHLGIYYVLFPMIDIGDHPLNMVYAEYTEHIRDKSRVMIREFVEPASRVLADVETYLRSNIATTNVSINIDAYLAKSSDAINYGARKMRFLKEYADGMDINLFLTEYPASFQISFLEEAILFFIYKDKISAPGPVIELYKEVVDLLRKFDVIIYLSEVIKYKDTAKQYKVGLPNIPPDTPVGYMSTKSLQLFDPHIVDITKTGNPENGKWISINKMAMNRQPRYRENSIIVGYLEPGAENMRFKLRKPMDYIKSSVSKGMERRRSVYKSVGYVENNRRVAKDNRLIEKGIVCITKNKQDLTDILNSLGVNTTKLKLGDVRIRKLCSLIKNRLIDLEIGEREKDSRYKYLYSWWDEIPVLSVMV